MVIFLGGVVRLLVPDLSAGCDMRKDGENNRRESVTFRKIKIFEIQMLSGAYPG